MTSLRTFQSEIDEIHHREVAKQRTLPIDAGKDSKHKQQLPAASTKGKAKDEGHTNGQDTGAVVGIPTRTSTRSEMLEVEEKVLTLLQSNVPAEQDNARDMIAALLTQHRGEYVLRLGMQPPHAHLFAGDLTDESDGWVGVQRTEEELDLLKERVTRTVEEVGGKTSVLFETRNGTTHPRISLLLRLPPPNVSLTPEVRCAVVGNVDSGKSTTLGVLTRGALDDGRGRARVGLFRHKHEIETGRTSSVGMEILGFGPSGAPILPNTTHSADADAIRREKLGWEEISIQAAKIVSFIDLAGHERYLKTTLYGLTSGAPSCVILIVGANAGLIGMSKEHLAIALALSVPVVVCITKIDMTPANKTAETIKQVVKILKSPGCREADNEKFAVDQPLEFSVTEVWSVPYVGTVVNGIMNSGSVKAGDAVLLGPDANGTYIPTVIKSMQRKRADVATAEAGQCVSFALKRVRRSAVRKGMVLVPKSETPPKSTRQFEGQVLILYHNTTLQKNYQAMLHCGAVRQTVRIVEMDHPQGVLRTGDRATVQFEFISHPEFVKEGMKLLFREGKTKGLGVITRLLERFPATPQRDISDHSTEPDHTYSLSPDPRQWGSDLSMGFVEADDHLHNPTHTRKVDRGGSIFTSRGVANFGCLLILGVGLLGLFVGYPVITHFTKTQLSTLGGFNIGGINATGQIPSLTGNYGLIDLDTPKSAYTIPAWTAGGEMQLVFSEEFNVDGRTFYPGDDPYWEAVDLHYWQTNNLEWYDPEAVTTANGSLVITFSQKETHGLNYEGGPNNVVGLWPAVWTMGNLGRAGYGASLEGMWPYTYDSCDVGTAPNQTINGKPAAAVTQGDPFNGNHLSFLPGQRLSRCTCAGESHPGPVHSDGSYVGRSAPEIDVFEALPFNANYEWLNTTQNLIIPNATTTEYNLYIGGVFQMTTSALTNTNPTAYELNGGGFSTYGFEYLPGFDTGYITWITDNKIAWTLRAPGLAGDDTVKVSARPVPQEPMYIIINLGMSENFGNVDFEHLTFPVHMFVDYIRVYQPSDAINIGCSPVNFPTEAYINTCVVFCAVLCEEM
ncbi:hypothetical protein DXG03_003392 [Asterophora parasitica]|uniref:Tr-type G domain-containing protein n=1 Tax=Asterophora parasitica TaxID=117018 RepID=A0A9P7K9G3_9AGAR|nr:hypothetical protein DXG03_003392 [Asterophora parasitica]